MEKKEMVVVRFIKMKNHSIVINNKWHRSDVKQINNNHFTAFFLLQFRHLLEQRTLEASLNNQRRKCPPGCNDTCTAHPVQQGEVSSTEPPLPEPSSLNGHSPEKSAYFEAVQHYISNVGWALLEINSEGVIECATENVIDVLHYSRDELNGQSIYSYLHTGDHSKVSPILDKNSFLLEWDQDDGPVSISTKNTLIFTKILPHFRCSHKPQNVQFVSDGY